LREIEGTFYGAWQILNVINTVDPLAEGAVNLALVCVRVEVHFLVGMPTVIVGWHVACDDHHRYGIQRRVRDAGCSVREAWPKVTE
jgi:hypothetical protein